MPRLKGCTAVGLRAAGEAQCTLGANELSLAETGEESSRNWTGETGARACTVRRPREGFFQVEKA